MFAIDCYLFIKYQRVGLNKVIGEHKPSKSCKTMPLLGNFKTIQLQHLHFNMGKSLQVFKRTRITPPKN